MQGTNRVVEIGRLCSDPELKYTNSGVPVVTARLAVPIRKQSDGRESFFVDIRFWRQNAENACQILKKGSLVCIDGKLDIRPWVAQDGTKRSSTVIDVDFFQNLTKRPAAEEGDSSPTNEAPSDNAENDPFEDE